MDDTGPFATSPRLFAQRFVAAVAIALGMLGAIFAKESFIKDVPLADVRITGNRTIPAEAILSHVKSRPGRPASGSVISDDVQELYRTRWFITVSPRVEQTDKGPVLIFEVIERPVVETIEYRGNDEIDDEHLSALTGLTKGSPYDPHSNIEAARRIENHYKEEGYTFAKVTLIAGDDADGRDVIFQIHEGPKVRVENVIFEGNSGWTIASGLADANLRMKLVTSRMFPILPGIVSLPFGGLYKPDTIPQDIASLELYYHSLGFFDVEITHKKLFNEDKSRLVIKYNIDEGKRYRIANIKYQGNQVYSEKELVAERALKPGDFFSKRELNEDVTHMQDMYGELGRLFSSVDPVIQYSETPGKVSLVFDIDEDRPIYVRNITTEIRGENPHTRETLILNISKIHPGDLADPDLIRRTKSRVAGAGYFQRGPTNGVDIDIKRVGLGDFYGDTGLAKEKSLPQTGLQPASFDPQSFGPPAVQPASAEGQSSTVFRGQNAESFQTGNNPFLPPRQTSQISSQTSPQSAATYARPTRSARKTTPTYLPPTTSPFASRATPVSGTVIPASAQTAPVSGTGTSPFQTYNASPAIPQPAVRTADAIVNPYTGPPVIQPLAGQVGDYTPPFIHSSPQGDPFSDYVPPNQRPGYIDLHISATEARTGRLMIGAGVNSNSGVNGNIVFSENNFDICRFPRSFADIWNGTAFRGAGQTFRIEAVPGNVFSRYLVSWTDPYFLDSAFSLGTSGFYFQRFYPDWNEHREGGRVNVGRQITRNFSLRGIFSASNVNVSNPDYPTPPILAKAVGDNTLITAGGGFTWDNRDSAMLPSEGQIIKGTYTQGITDFQYPRFDLQASQYYTIFSRPDGTGKHVLSLAGQLGWTGDDTPVFERYFAGGFQTLRGFQFRGVGPRQYGVNIGGQFLLLGSVQYMFPLLANDALHGVVFSDFGTINSDISLDNFRASVGTGLRISIPAFGPAPLAFDFAFPIAKADGDQQQIFSFYVGFQR